MGKQLKYPQVGKYTGKTVGLLTVGMIVCRKDTGRAMYEFICDKGHIVVRVFPTSKRASKYTCTLCNRGQSKAKGYSKHPLFPTWKGMYERCNNPKHKMYSNYGGRGIKICESWADPARFFEDIGDKPTMKHTLDRIDNNGNYCPENCRWVTSKEQARNRRSNHCLSYKGRTLPISEWAELLGLNKHTIRRRLAKGWSVAEALETPKGGRNYRILCYKGEEKTVTEWATLLGTTVDTLCRRLKNGWSVAKTVTEPVARRTSRGTKRA